MTDMRSEVVEGFRTTLRGPVLQADDPDYDSARSIWNAMIDRRPALIARCTGTADVLASVAFARAHGLPLAVRGGGHGIAGTAIVDDGLVIDLSAMRGVHVDPKRAARACRAGRCWPTSTTRPRPSPWRSRSASTRPPAPPV